jgi:hypothetical protein
MVAKSGGPGHLRSAHRLLVKQRNLPSLFSAQLESKESHCGYEKSIASDGDKLNNEEEEKKKKHRKTE